MITLEITLEVTFGGYSTAGVKPDNEDAFAAFLPTGTARALKGAVAAIADGVSASRGAQKASHTAVSQFIDDYLAAPDTWTVRQAAARVLRALNRWLYQHGREDGTLVTTFSALIFKSTTVHVLHAGDCRVWRLRRGDLSQLSRDHRLGDARLTRALGMDLDLEVDYLIDEARPGDLYVLTTDGVHDWLAAMTIREQLSREIGLEEAARALVVRALTNGSNDNASCLLARIEQLPAASVEETHRRLARQAVPPALDVGAVLDGYRVVRVLSESARSHLYLVVDPEGREIAMKVPSLNHADDPVCLEAFLREQWIAGRVLHPGIMEVLPRPDDSKFLYALYEHIEGQTLRQWILDHPRPPLDEVRRIVRELAFALRALQRLQMVHRDLKPENVMIDRAGRARIVDLGSVHVAGFDEIAAAITSEAPEGSAGYVAPECLTGVPGTHLADLYSLGVITYEMLTGCLPYPTPANPRDPSSYSGLEYRSACGINPSVPPWLDLTLAKAIARQPERRYASLSEFLKDLTEPNRAMVRRSESAPLIQRNPVRFWQLVSGVLVLLLVFAALR